MIILIYINITVADITVVFIISKSGSSIVARRLNKSCTNAADLMILANQKNQNILIEQSNHRNFRNHDN